MTVTQYSYLALARVNVWIIENADELHPPWLLDDDEQRMMFWKMPVGINDIQDCIQWEYYEDFGEEWIRFRKPVECYRFKLITLSDRNILASHLEYYNRGVSVEKSVGDVFGECIPQLREIACRDIELQKKFEESDYCFDSTFTGIFEATTWSTTPRWAQNDPQTEWITETVSQSVRFIGILDEGRLGDFVAPSDYVPFKAWRANSKHNTVSVWPSYEEIHSDTEDKG